MKEKLIFILAIICILQILKQAHALVLDNSQNIERTFCSKKQVTTPLKEAAERGKCENFAKSVGLIEVSAQSAGSKPFQGVGTLIRQNVIITSAHVVEPCLNTLSKCYFILGDEVPSNAQIQFRIKSVFIPDEYLIKNFKKRYDEHELEKKKFEAEQGALKNKIDKFLEKSDNDPQKSQEILKEQAEQREKLAKLDNVAKEIEELHIKEQKNSVNYDIAIAEIEPIRKLPEEEMLPRLDMELNGLTFDKEVIKLYSISVNTINDNSSGEPLRVLNNKEIYKIRHIGIFNILKNYNQKILEDGIRTQLKLPAAYSRKCTSAGLEYPSQFAYHYNPSTPPDLKDVPFLQASLQPGDSGGPLLRQTGRTPGGELQYKIVGVATELKGSQCGKLKPNDFFNNVWTPLFTHKKWIEQVLAKIPSPR